MNIGRNGLYQRQMPFYRFTHWKFSKQVQASFKPNGSMVDTTAPLFVAPISEKTFEPNNVVKILIPCQDQSQAKPVQNNGLAYTMSKPSQKFLSVETNTQILNQS